MATVQTFGRACESREARAARMFRAVGGVLLVAVSLLEFGMASLMCFGARSLPTVAFLFCTLALFVCSVIAFREPAPRVLTAAQSAAAAGLLALFWAGADKVHGGPSVRLGHSTYDLTLTLAGVLFIALLLARLLRRDETESTACNCG